VSTEQELRCDARACLDAAIAAVEPRGLVAAHLRERSEIPAGERVWVAGIGKAAAAMARGAVDVLGERATPGPLIVPSDESSAPEGFEVFRGGHPIPNEGSRRGAEAIHRLAEGLGEGEHLLFMVSGGGSALMALPPEGVELADVLETTRLLLRAGATIGELNAVRKHLDQLKGGRLARLATPARVTGLVLSDVVGDPLDTIASGPLSGDPSTFEEAAALLRRLEVWDDLPPGVRRHVEQGVAGEVPDSPKPGDACFEGVEVEIVGNNRLAAEAALEEAACRGYRTLLLTTFLTGEAREIGRALAALGREVRRSGRPLAAPACLVTAGETTVTVRGSGKGGRNQELALGAALALEGETGILVASAGTDGIDGPTEAAGAWATGTTIERARKLGLDPHDTLARNDAYPFFDALDDLIVTGPTGTNVMDVQLVLVR